MFSYPLNRIKLIASKLTIIMVYTAISMTIGYICCSSYCKAYGKRMMFMSVPFIIGIIIDALETKIEIGI